MWSPEHGKGFMDISTVNLPGPFSQRDMFSDALTDYEEKHVKQAILRPGEVKIVFFMFSVLRCHVKIIIKC